MPTSFGQESVRDFLDEYGRALSQGDLASIVRCWAVPALVLSDQGARLVLASTEIEEFFNQAVSWYHGQGIAETRPAKIEIEVLGDRLFEVDALWLSFDAEGVERSSERSRYILLLAEDGRPRIRVAISVQPTTGGSDAGP